MSRPQVIFSRDELLNLTRGRDIRAFDRSVNMHISHLRQKLRALCPARTIIKTVWDSGYVFLEPGCDP